MSLRNAKNTMTGRPTRRVEVVVGHRPDGQPGVTLHPQGYGHVCIASPLVLAELIGDLKVALSHMEGGPQ